MGRTCFQPSSPASALKAKHRATLEQVAQLKGTRKQSKDIAGAEAYYQAKYNQLKRECTARMAAPIVSADRSSGPGAGVEDREVHSSGPRAGVEGPAPDGRKLCGHPTRKGMPCSWPRPCPVHKAEEAQDHKRRRLDVEGRCGPNCSAVRGDCKFHPQEGQRCESCLDAKPDQQCSLAKAGVSNYCCWHQQFPNLPKVLLQYAREHGSEFQVEDFLKACYPEATEPPFDLNAFAATLLNTSSSSSSSAP